MALTNSFIWDVDEVMVFDQGIQCITAPCPHYLVMDRLGFQASVASLDFGGYGEVPVDMIPPEGLVVRGDFRAGDWTPGATGNVMRISDTVGTPATYLTYDANTGSQGLVHDSAVGLLTAQHTDLWAHTMNLELLGLDREYEQYLLDDLYRARYVVNGWLTYTWWGGWAELTVTGIQRATQLYSVEPTGIECITDPCPYWDVLDINGEPITQIASVDFHVMGVTTKAEERMRNEIETGNLFRALILPGSWEPLCTGTVLYVTEDPRADDV